MTATIPEKQDILGNLSREASARAAQEKLDATSKEFLNEMQRRRENIKLEIILDYIRSVNAINSDDLLLLESLKGKTLDEINESDKNTKELDLLLGKIEEAAVRLEKDFVGQYNEQVHILVDIKRFINEKLINS